MDIHGKLEDVMFRKFFEKWKRKKKIDQAGDILFIIFLIALLIPDSRMAITVALKRVIAFSPKEIQQEDRQNVAASGFNWPMETLNGKKVNLEDFRGKTIFINEWATWCPPCVAEMPSIEKLYNQLKDDKNVVFILVSNENRETVSQFLNKEGLDLPVMVTRANPPEMFAVRSIPTTFLVSPSGEIVLRETGSRKWHGEDTVELIRSLQ